MNKEIQSNKFSDVPIRIISWVYIIIILSIGIINSITTAIFVSLLCYQANREFIRMFMPKYSSILVPTILSIIQLFLLLKYAENEYLAFATLLILCTIIGLKLMYNLKPKTILFLTFALASSLISLSFLYFIRIISIPEHSYIGLKLLLFLIIVTELNDVFQYLSGKFFGKNAIVPMISPNKTVEGLLGGIILSICLSNILGFFLFSFYHWHLYSLFGFLLSIVGFAGDVTISYIKRIDNIKDTGTLIPGHGGLLDRIDSLLFNAPLFYILTQYLILV